MDRFSSSDSSAERSDDTFDEDFSPGGKFFNKELSFIEQELIKKRREHIKGIKKHKRLLIDNDINKWCSVKGKGFSQ